MELKNLRENNDQIINYILHYILQSYVPAGQKFTHEQVLFIVELRSICSILSSLACVFIIILYIIMFVNYRWNKYMIIRQEESQSNVNNSLDESCIDTNNDMLIRQSSKSNKKLKRKRNSNKQLNNKMGIGIHLIFFLILTNLGWCVGSIFGLDGFNSEKDNEKSGCIAQAIIQNYFDISTICWNSIISAITLLGTRACYTDMKKINNKFYLFLIYSNIFPLILSLGPYFTNDYGSAGVWCWINLQKLDTSRYIWIVLINLFNWLNIFYTIYALFTASKFFSIRKAEIGKDAEKIKEIKFLGKYIFILRIFPMVVLITRFFGTFNRLYSMIFDHDSYELFCFHSVCTSLAGFLNSSIYFYFFRGVFKCCKKQKSININLSDQEGD
jgi:hypothetical protein